MLKQRVITASILAAVFIFVLFVTPVQFFTLLITAVVALAAWEWANLCSLEKASQRIAYAVLVVALGAVLGYGIFAATAVPLDKVLLVSGIWWAVALLWVQGYPASAVLWQSVFVRAVMGIIVLLPTLMALYALRSMANGELVVLALVLLVAAADIGAYFSGRAFGRHKLAPKVSPGKTWEGVVGGLALVAIIASCYALITHAPLWMTLLVALPAAAASVLGDLLESMLKRHRGIKDSSSLLPGHGGILDRIDGLVAAAPVFALVVVLTGWQI